MHPMLFDEAPMFPHINVWIVIDKDRELAISCIAVVHTVPESCRHRLPRLLAKEAVLDPSFFFVHVDRTLQLTAR